MPLAVGFSESCLDLTHNQAEAIGSDSFLVNVEKHKLGVATTINDEGQSPRRTEGGSVLNETTPESLKDTNNTTLIESTPPLLQQPPSDSPTTEPQLSASTRMAIGQSRDTLIGLEECIPATQIPVTKKRKQTKAITHPETPSKTLQMLLSQSSSPTVNNPDEKPPSGKSSSIFDGSGTLAASEASPVASKKRVRNESHETNSKGSELVLTTTTPSILIQPPTQKAKRPRFERPVVPKREVANQKVSEAEKGEKIAGSASRTATEKTGPKDITRPPSPTAGPKRKRAPTKRG